ncbi:MAG: hypothetical protein KC416_04900 [Myxococcales bacterium]|nr:hypothetical protein [Myxococcales bacterium]
MLAILLGVVALFGPAGAVAAQGRQGMTGPCFERSVPSRVVDVHLSVGAEKAAHLAETIAGLLSNMEVTLCLTKGPPVTVDRIANVPFAPAPSVARIWIHRGTKVLKIYVVNGVWDRILERRVPLRRGIDEVAVEEGAHIVQSSVEALLAGALLGVTRPEFMKAQMREKEEASSVAPTPPARPSRPDETLRVDMGLRFASRGLGGGAVLGHSLGFLGAVTWGRGDLRPVLAMTLGYILPSTPTAAPVVVETQGGEARLLVGGAWVLGPNTEVWGLVGAGVDVQWIGAAAAVEPGTLGVGDQTEWLPFAMGSITLRQSLVAGFFLSLAVEGHFDILDLRYVVDNGVAAPEIVDDPWRFQPGMSLSVGAALP